MLVLKSNLEDLNRPPGFRASVLGVYPALAKTVLFCFLSSCPCYHVSEFLHEAKAYIWVGMSMDEEDGFCL